MTMNQEYTTAEELADELAERDYVERVRVVHENVVSFEVTEGVHLFQFPEHSGWYVDDMTHYEGESISISMEFVV